MAFNTFSNAFRGVMRTKFDKNRLDYFNDKENYYNNKNELNKRGLQQKVDIQEAVKERMEGLEQAYKQRNKNARLIKYNETRAANLEKQGLDSSKQRAKLEELNKTQKKLDKDFNKQMNSVFKKQKGVSSNGTENNEQDTETN